MISTKNFPAIYLSEAAAIAVKELSDASGLTLKQAADRMVLLGSSALERHAGQVELDRQNILSRIRAHGRKAST